VLNFKKAKQNIVQKDNKQYCRVLDTLAAYSKSPVVKKKLVTGARLIIRNPENKHILTLPGSSTLTIRPVG
jgi:hypothetical protein